MDNQDLTKCEFLLTLEGNIIIQRFFNVKDFNPDAKNSIDLYDVVTDICEIISQDLKEKNSEYLYENQNYILNLDNVEDKEEIKESYFLLEVKHDEEVFIQRIFPAHVYHPKARWVDIRPKVRMILGMLTNVLSTPDVETIYKGKYFEYNLIISKNQYE